MKKNTQNKKTPTQSFVEMTELILPNDTNLLGNLIGGKLMYWIDIAAGMSALRYANGSVATASLEKMDFHHPIPQGSMVHLKAKVIWTGKTSMKIQVKVFAEDYTKGENTFTNSALLTFVALDKNQKPRLIPVLQPESEQEIKDFKYEESRYQKRKNNKS